MYSGENKTITERGIDQSKCDAFNNAFIVGSEDDGHEFWSSAVANSRFDMAAFVSQSNADVTSMEQVLILKNYFFQILKKESFIRRIIKLLCFLRKKMASRR